MSVVIIGGNERMSRQYADVCAAHGYDAKVFPKETGPIEEKDRGAGSDDPVYPNRFPQDGAGCCQGSQEK